MLRTLTLVLGVMLITSITAAQDATLNQYLADWVHHDGHYVQEVVAVNGQSQDDLFTACRDWLAEELQTTPDFETVADRESGVLIVKGWKWYSRTLSDSGHKLWATFKIEVRDGRFRYTIFDVYTDLSDSDFAGLENEFNLERRVGHLYRKDGTLREGSFKKRTMEVFDALEDYREDLRDLQYVAETKNW